MRMTALAALVAALLSIPATAGATTPAPQPVNPSCSTDISSWYSTGGSVSRDTTTYQSAPASCSWTPGSLFYGVFSDYFAVGVTYILDFSFRGVVDGGGIAMADTQFGTSTGLILADSTRWKRQRLTFTPTFPGYAYLGFRNLRPGSGGAPLGLLVDDVALTSQIS